MRGVLHRCTLQCGKDADCAALQSFSETAITVGLALAGKAPVATPEVYGVHTGPFPAEAGPTEALRSSREDRSGFKCAFAKLDTHSAKLRSVP